MADIERTLVTEAWVPSWAPPHVTATYTPIVRDHETGLVDEPQHVVCNCSNCGGEWKQDCPTGAARSHIQAFAKVHSTCKKG